ncbi:MAG: glycosyltransferase family 4 protein, partial [Bacteroidota bacterium]
MKKRVLHLVRKKAHLKSSFIKNQMSNHLNYSPYHLFRFKKLTLADQRFIESDLNTNKENRIEDELDLSANESLFEKVYFLLLKKITPFQAKKISSFAIKNDIDILHFHFGSDAGIYYPFLRKAGLPSIVSFYGYDCSEFPNRYHGLGKLWLQYRVFRHASKIIAMSPDMKNDLLKLGCPEEKIVVHHHGNDVHRFYTSERVFSDKEMVTILNLCTMVPQKGQMFLLYGIKKLIEKGVTNFTLRIGGAGELEQQLKSFVNENDLSPYVQFLGPLEYGSPEMVREYHEADFFVHPSVIDPLGCKEGIPGMVGYSSTKAGVIGLV